MAHAIVLGILLLGFAIELASGSGRLEHGLLIAAALGIAGKYFGKKDDDGGDVQGDHPTTRFQFRAMNLGDFEGAEDVIGADFQAYANGYPMLSGEVAHGPDLFVDLVSYWRAAIPDVHWELYDEVVQRAKGKSETVALRLVSTGTIEQHERDIEIASFARVVDHKVVEWRIVTDLTVFNEYRAAVGLPILE